jgi:hypothetical protein
VLLNSSTLHLLLCLGPVHFILALRVYSLITRVFLVSSLSLNLLLPGIGFSRRNLDF